MYQPIAFWTIGIVVITCLVSWRGFRNRRFEADYIFNPPSILAAKEFYRLLTSGFLHADFPHLAFNMVSLYLFAGQIEIAYGAAQFLAIYLGSMLGAGLLSLWLHRHHDYYAYGASGGVAGIIFAHIFLFPGGKISMFYLPIGIPSWLYAVVFLLGTFYALKARRDNIGHDAHLGGAIAGLALTAALNPEVAKYSPKLFWILAITASVMLVYLLKNPLFLPLANLAPERVEPMRHRYGATRKPTTLSVDAILDKISAKGLDSLSKEERAYLDNVSAKYRNREVVKERESELLF